MKTKVIVISTVGLIYDGITSVIRSCLKAMDLSGLEIHVVATGKAEPDICDELGTVPKYIKTHTFKSYESNTGTIIKSLDE